MAFQTSPQKHSLVDLYDVEKEFEEAHMTNLRATSLRRHNAISVSPNLPKKAIKDLWTFLGHNEEFEEAYTTNLRAISLRRHNATSVSSKLPPKKAKDLWKFLGYNEEFEDKDTGSIPVELEDPRRFHIYFKINEVDQPVRISNLKLLEYLHLKDNDEYAITFCQQHFVPEGIIRTLHRSVDDVEYLLVRMDK